MDMKKINYTLLLLASIIMLFTISCSKDGAAGPKGDTGDKGSTGAVGPAGPAGANGTAGNMIYSGTTTPVATKGAIGDYYLDTATGLLYGPKTATGWGGGLSLKGATGATGAAGSTTLSGAGVPAPSLGKTGDYYLDKINYLLYGPKSGSGWGAPVNLRGPVGPQGPEGNANVQTEIFIIESNQWNNNFNYPINGSYNPVKGVEHYSSLITADVLNAGMILVYFQADPNGNTAQWQPLPFTYPGVGYNYNYAYETFVGKINLYFYFTPITKDPPATSTYQPFTTKYKILAVSGHFAIQLQQNHINVNKYEEVSKFLNIK
ncbi:collagen-like protein [Mucilaginibacter sp. HC2]|nr:collagen-like protein [Mucilaginibacter inviolabilis]